MAFPLDQLGVLLFDTRSVTFEHILRYNELVLIDFELEVPNES